MRTLAHSLQELGIYFYLRLRTFPTIEYLGFGHNLTPVFAKKKTRTPPINCEINLPILHVRNWVCVVFMEVTKRKNIR